MSETSSLKDAPDVLLVSTYEMGRQPFGLASAATWLSDEGASVQLRDVSVVEIGDDEFSGVDLIGFYLPMHTATRLAAPLIERSRSRNPDARIVAFGTYAPLNKAYLRELGVDTVLGGEFEKDLIDLYGSSDVGKTDVVAEPSKGGHLRFKVPDRSTLPGLENYAQLRFPTGETKTAGYTEASRGCRHLCRHCPVVPVYQGRFSIVQPEVVLEDIANQVEAGAEHITFGDPDFFNGPAHAMRVVKRMNEAFSSVTYDATIKVQHLAERLDLVPWLKETGCVFVTTAVESFDDRALSLLNKGHSLDDFSKVLTEFRRAELAMAPTFVAFAPWTTLESYGDFLAKIRHFGLEYAVAPIQYAIRLLFPEGSLLLDLPDLKRLVEPFDPRFLTYPWNHEDPEVDRLHKEILSVVSSGHDDDRLAVFDRVWKVAEEFEAVFGDPVQRNDVYSRATIPYMNEPWYC